MLQVLALQQMQSAVINDEYTPASQRAQVAQPSAALSNLVKVQGGAHTSERLKTIETVLIRVVKTLPEAGPTNSSPCAGRLWTGSERMQSRLVQLHLRAFARPTNRLTRSDLARWIRQFTTINGKSYSFRTTVSGAHPDGGRIQ